jgi:hypothetical protein
MDQLYWIRHPDGPFTTLIRIAATYLHPEADDLESLQQLAKRADRPEMRIFKSELRQAITHPGPAPASLWAAATLLAEAGTPFQAVALASNCRACAMVIRRSGSRISMPATTVASGGAQVGTGSCADRMAWKVAAVFCSRTGYGLPRRRRA